MTLIHILGMGFVFAVIIFADKEAFAWMRGKKEILDAQHLRLIHQLTWLGLSILVISGIFLFYPRREYLAAEPLFIIKMLFVGILLTNGVLVGRLMHIATQKPFAMLTHAEKVQLFASGAASFISWVGAFVLGIILFA